MSPAFGKMQILLMALLMSALAPARAAQTRAESRAEFGYDPIEEFIQFDSEYRAKKRKFATELRELQLELARQAGSGRETPCSRQIFLEARWLVYYSAHWERIEKRLAALRKILAEPSDPPDAREQVESDGSYDHCSEAWFLKLDSTVEEIEDRAARWDSPKHPLRLLDRINSPQQLRAYLDSLLISEVRKTGIDNRYELNIAITALIRLIRGDLGNVYPFHPELEKTLLDYLDNHWQDHETGYYGGWYRLPDGSIRRTADLSITFHIVSYRQDNSLRIPQMVETTLAFKDNEYPFGWLEEGVKSNHHNYDVARLFRIGWTKMTEEQRDEARTAMRGMIEFCLKETMNADGSFKMMDEDTVGSSFLFPVSLLDEVGYFRKSRRFWTSDDFPEALTLAKRIETKINAMGLKDTESRKALRRLKTARWEANGGRILWVGIFVMIGWAVWKWKKSKGKV